MSMDETDMGKGNHNKGYYVLYQVSCAKATPKQFPAFHVVDTGDDPRVRCPVCKAEMDLHNITESLVSSGVCWRCSGSGKSSKGANCVTCDGTGIEHFHHTRKVVGRLYIDVLREAAKKEPYGWGANGQI